MTKSKQQITYQTDSNGKKMLTTDVIKNTLIANTCNQKQAYGGLLMVGGGLLLCFTIICTVLGGFMELILFIPGVLCLYFGKKKEKTAQENKINAPTVITA